MPVSKAPCQMLRGCGKGCVRHTTRKAATCNVPATGCQLLNGMLRQGCSTRPAHLWMYDLLLECQRQQCKPVHNTTLQQCTMWATHAAGLAACSLCTVRSCRPVNTS